MTDQQSVDAIEFLRRARQFQGFVPGLQGRLTRIRIEPCTHAELVRSIAGIGQRTVALPCQVPGNTWRTQPRGLLAPLIYPPHESFGAVATSRTGAAPTAGSGVIATTPLPACCMTWAICWEAVPVRAIALHYK